MLSSCIQRSDQIISTNYDQILGNRSWGSNFIMSFVILWCHQQVNFSLHQQDVTTAATGTKGNLWTRLHSSYCHHATATYFKGPVFS